MKVIDLLNKIANGEEVPKKIRITDIDDRITRHYNFFYDEDDQEYKDDELFPLGARLILDRVLNKKVEISDIEYLNNELGNKLINPFLEQKKIPEKLNEDFNQHCNEYLYKKVEDKVNEIIDYLEGKGK